MFGIKKKNNGLDKQQTRELNRKRLLNENSSFDVVESYKEIRTNIIFSLPKTGCKVVAISSSVAGEGKSTTCFNTALTFSETGVRVLVIDCDLRRPNIAKLLNIKNERGLSNILVNESKLKDCISSEVYPGVDVISSGTIPPNPAELLASDGFKYLLEDLKKSYDYIFLDTPPVAIVTDTLLISENADGVVMVARQNVVDKRVLSDAIGKLRFAKAKIIGFVLNDMDYSKSSYKYQSYNYKYEYK